MTSAIVVAAGSGARVGEGCNKLLLPVNGRPVIWWTLRAIAECNSVHELVLVTREDVMTQMRSMIGTASFCKRVSRVAIGGKERQDSVFQGLRHISESAEYVMVHDGARPLITPNTIEIMVNAARQSGAAVSATPLSDTVKSADHRGWVINTLDRKSLWTVQTPQVFQRELLMRAHQKAREEDYHATDDATLVERLGYPVQLVDTKQPNMKITTPEDFPIVESLLRAREKQDMLWPRVGLGYDIHRFSPERPLFLGGVRIESPLGLAGHSDADVLLHAMCDALLGAVGQRDIGYHFPDTDPALADVSSLHLLQRALHIVRSEGYAVNNIDCIVIAEQPRLSQHIPNMVKTIASEIRLAEDSISIKATTNEKLGAIGRCEGIAAHAVVTVIPLRVG